MKTLFLATLLASTTCIFADTQTSAPKEVLTPAQIESAKHSIKKAEKAIAEKPTMAEYMKDAQAAADRLREMSKRVTSTLKNLEIR